MFKVSHKDTRATPKWSNTLKSFVCFDQFCVLLDSLLLSLNIFHTFSQCFYCWLWTCSVQHGYNDFHRLKPKTVLKSDSHIPKKKIICFDDSPSKMLKNVFYFILKVLFVLRIFKFLSWLFGHVENDLIRKIRLISKLMTSQPG